MRTSFWQRSLAVLLLAAVAGVVPAFGEPTEEAGVHKVDVPGLERRVIVRRDANNAPHIFAKSDKDAAFIMGWVHAEDRFFQMDLQRHLFAGTVSELLGEAALFQDTQTRLLNMQGAAQRTWDALPDVTREWIQSYSDGVNAYFASGAALPPEYAALELTSVAPWSPLDSVLIGKGIAWSLSFDLSDLDYTNAFGNYLQIGQILGFDGVGLFFDDMFRNTPFEESATVPDFIQQSRMREVPDLKFRPDNLPDYMTQEVFDLVRDYTSRLRAEAPFLSKALERHKYEEGSNWWLAHGDVTTSGAPMFANDPHLILGAPSVFYEVHLRIKGPGTPLANVIGVSFPGTPGVIQGCNNWICWGSTVLPLDVTDVYVEQLLIDPATGLPTATVFEGEAEPIEISPQTYFVNQIGDGTPDNLANANVGPLDGGLSGNVPRRNNGPIIGLNLSNPLAPIAISAQWTGWGPTFELEFSRQMMRASTLARVEEALQNFDVGAQNFAVADKRGRIAYYGVAEVPIREDLQTLGGPDGGAPPVFLRDGTHGSAHEWLAVQNPQPNQALPFEILPFEELPQARNPASGYLINANNDPVGVSFDNNPFNTLRPDGGVYYLSVNFAPGLRQGRIQRLVQEDLASGKISFNDIKAFQANNQLLDAEVLVPYILAAFDNATAGGANAQLAALAGDTGVAEVVARLADWDFSTPTGLAEGYDPGDGLGELPDPSQREIDASVSATIYSLWRGQILASVIDGTLDRLGLDGFPPDGNKAMVALRFFLDNYDVLQGNSNSGVPFFVVPGVDDPEAARDILLLQAVRSALDLAASDEFAPAFGNSTDQDDYRWGFLHRIVFAHPIPPFSIPAVGGLQNLSDELLGVARSGGYGVVDASSHSPRASTLDGFMFGAGPSRRFVGNMREAVQAEQAIPGGSSGVLGNPFQTDQLREWLVNDYHKVLLTAPQVVANQRSVTRFDPAN